MSWSPEVFIGEMRPWPDSVHVVRGKTGEMMRYMPERTCHAIKEWNMIRTIKGWKCSECGLAMAIAPEDEDIPERPDYCPNCGAKVVD